MIAELEVVSQIVGIVFDPVNVPEESLPTGHQGRRMFGEAGSEAARFKSR
jgi:hypothetical protein